MKLASTILSLLLLYVMAASCDEDTPVQQDDLSITGFSPLAALPGDTVTISGSGFDPEPVRNVVQFASSSEGVRVPLSTVIASTTSELKAIVPANTVSGPVKVAVGQYSILSPAPFLLSPIISVVEPASARPGEQIVLGGQNLTANASDVVLFVGDVAIDSIFGASVTQLAFPLPLSTPVGPTTIRYGVKLGEDIVFAEPINFVVLDAEKPEFFSVSPNAETRGKTIILTGANFVPTPGRTSVNFGTTIIEDFVNITPTEITLVVPDLTPGVYNLSITVLKSNDEPATTAEQSFTLLEVIDMPVYYWTYGNRLATGPSGIQRYFEGAKQSVPGATSFLGLALNSDNTQLYALHGYSSAEVRSSPTTPSGFTGQATLVGSPADASYAADIAYSANKLYYSRTADDPGIWVYNIATKKASKLYNLKLPGEGDEYPVRAANIKISGGLLFWTEFVNGKTVVAQANLTTDVNPDDPDVIVDNTDFPALKSIQAISVNGNDLFIVNSDYQYPGAIATNSTIYRASLSGAITLTPIYDGNVGRIADIEFRNGSLYYITYSTSPNGGIYRVAPNGGSTPELIVGEIQYGAYLEIENE